MSILMAALKLKLRFALSYWGHDGVGLAQAFLKTSIVPLTQLDQLLPKAGEIWDLGCGEGILANLIAICRPDATVVGVDRDKGRIQIAQSHSQPNARFELSEIYPWLTSGKPRPAAIIFNDVIHHQEYHDQAVLLQEAIRCLSEQGVLILKEVDQADSIDRLMTTLFDRRLYPNDPLCFRALTEWVALFASFKK